MMRIKFITFVILAGASLACGTGEQTASSRPAAQQSAPTVAKSAPQAKNEHAHSPAAAHNHQGRVPAHYKNAASIGQLPPTLAPDQFTGKVRLAYEVAREIPATLAQLPCYCHCDQSVGHKSLHSCFQDNHGAHCGVCLDEALLAYRLQKDQRLTPEQIRQTIIDNYKAH